MMRIKRSEIRVIGVGGMEVCLRGVGMVLGRCVGLSRRCSGGVSWGCGGGVGDVCRGCRGGVSGGVREVFQGVSGGVGEVCWGWDDVEKCEDGSRPATRSALLSGYLGKSGHLPR